MKMHCQPRRSSEIFLSGINKRLDAIRLRARAYAERYVAAPLGKRVLSEYVWMAGKEILETIVGRGNDSREIGNFSL
jgi:hypothetical protein